MLVDHVEKVRRKVDELARVPDARHRLAPTILLLVNLASTASQHEGQGKRRSSELSP